MFHNAVFVRYTGTVLRAARVRACLLVVVYIICTPHYRMTMLVDIRVNVRIMLCLCTKTPDELGREIMGGKYINREKELCCICTPLFYVLDGRFFAASPFSLYFGWLQQAVPRFDFKYWASRIHLPSVVTLLGQRLRRCPNHAPILDKCTVLAGY